MDAEEQMISDAFEQESVSLRDPDPELLSMLRQAGENTFRREWDTSSIISSVIFARSVVTLPLHDLGRSV